MSRHGQEQVTYSDNIRSLPSIDLDDDDLSGCSPTNRTHQKYPALIPRLASTYFFTKVANIIQTPAHTVYKLLNLPLLVIGVQYILLAVATGFCLGRGHSVYALLAHFIKESVFFMLGFFELARYFGAFARFGMAWNAQPIEPLHTGQQKNTLTRICCGWNLNLQFWPDHSTMEYRQSFAIFIYGSTNVFLEHLGNNTGGKWSHKDLQHLSIAFMFFGGGLCGLILESASVFRTVCAAFGVEYKPPTVRTFSPNPMPGSLFSGLVP